MGLFSSKTKIYENKKYNLYLIEEKEDINLTLGLNIHIYGNLPVKNKIITELFKYHIKNEKYIKCIHKFKTDQFFWMINIYPDNSEKTFDLIIKEIVEDINRTHVLKQIYQHVVLCFGEENLELFINKAKDKGDDIFSTFNYYIRKRNIY